ncbi:tetratricopeptide repeat protein, partial [Gimesia chilikensis]|uniref:tetratricopeptide repeat protein n=1 Tax=Gimesia chilikensis TaxID=2605989 RepID=UPI0011EFCD39
NRGYVYGQRGETQQEIEDYTHVINLPEAPPDQIAKALVNRGYVYEQLGETQQATEDYTRVINLPEASPDQIAKALVNRGYVYGQLGETQQAIKDYTRVIDSPEAPPDQIAKALVNRGYVYGQRGETQQAIQDYTHVINKSEAPPDQIARALVGRSHRYNLLLDSENALSDTHKIAQISATSDEVKSMGAVNQGTALAHQKRWEESFSSYHSAISDFKYRVEHRKMLAADIILESSHSTLIAANPDFAERVLKFSVESFPVQSGKDAIELLQNLAKPEMKHRWSHVFRILKKSIPDKDCPSLEILAPVAEILDGVPTTNMNRLPPEQRNFVNEVLRRFEPDSK